MINVRKIVINAIDVQIGCILQVLGGLLFDHGDGSNADHKIQDEHNKRNDEHHADIMSDGVGFDSVQVCHGTMHHFLDCFVMNAL